MIKTSQREKIEKTAYWKAGLYLRLSQKDGDTESDSIGNQKEIALGYLEKEQDIILKRIYIDDGFSGLNFDRPDFQEMMEDLRQGAINCVLVKDLSRFGRDYLGVGQYLEREFPLLDVRFISILDHLDSYRRPDDMGNVLVPIKSIMNEEYCRDISRKIRSVLTTKRKNGEFIGNYAPYGYKKKPKNKHQLIIDEKVAWVVQKIFDLFVEGMPLMQISKTLNAEGIKTPSQYKVEQGFENFGKHSSNGKMCGKSWSITSIRRILTDEVYIGNLVQGQYKNKSYKLQKLTPVDKESWITVKNTHEPIIDQHIFNLAQDILNRNVRTSPREKNLIP